MQRNVGGLVVGFAVGLIMVAWLRLQTGSESAAGVLAGYATLLYIGLTIAAAVLFIRAGMPLRSLGFGPPVRPVFFLALGLVGFGLLQLSGTYLGPVWEQAFGAGRDLSRFDDIGGSMAQLLKVLALSWTVAAFGEEVAFRILLMRGVAYVLGDSRVAFACALVVQAAIFGLVHAYQGPAGVAGTATNALIYGGLTLAARGSIWPAALAHGLSNSVGLVSLYQGG